MFKTLLISIFTFLSATASAMPHASLNQLVQPDPECEQAKVSNGFADLVHQVNLVLQQGQTTWHDPRGPLSQKAAELGLSADEVQRIRKTTGYVLCPGNVSGGQSVVSAMLIGNGTQLVTDVHAFINPDTNERREPLSDCVFVNQYDHKAVKLDFSSDRSYKFYTNSPKAEWYKDRAIVHLKGRVPGARPFPLDLDGTPIQRGDKLIMVSADQEQMSVPMTKFKFSTLINGGKIEMDMDLNNEPIAQSCTAMGYYAPTSRSPSVLYSDCNSTVKASGSVQFIRGSDGGLRARALLSQSGGTAADFKSFKVGKDVPIDQLSFALSIGLDPDINSDVAQIEMANDNTRMATENSNKGF